MTIPGIDLTGGSPRYRALAGSLEEAIRSGRLSAGARLPPQRELAHELGVTLGTVSRAYDLIIQRGLARGEVGRGTYVLASEAPVEAPPPKVGAAGGVIDLTENRPAPTPVQAEIGRLARRVAESTDEITALAVYPPTEGYPRHREAAAAWLRSIGFPADAERTMLTSGAHASLAAGIVAFSRAGETILVEELTYSGLRSVGRTLQRRLEGVAVDAHGIVPESLASVCRQTRARLLILSPSVQNPMTMGLDIGRRQEIARIAREHELIIIEDEVYGPLLEERLPAIASFAPEHTVLLCSLSKFLSPGLRLGMAVAARPLLDRLAAASHDLAIAASSLNAAIFAQAYAEGVLAEALRAQRAAIARRWRIAREHLDGFDLRGGPHTLHGWLALDEDTEDGALAVTLASRGVRTAAASRFAVGRTRTAHGLRLCLGAPRSEEELERALDAVREVVGRAGPRVI